MRKARWRGSCGSLYFFPQRFIRFEPFIPRVMTNEETQEFLKKQPDWAGEELHPVQGRKRVCDLVQEQLADDSISPETIADLLPMWRVRQYLQRREISTRGSDADLRARLCHTLLNDPPTTLHSPEPVPVVGKSSWLPSDPKLVSDHQHTSQTPIEHEKPQEKKKDSQQQEEKRDENRDLGEFQHPTAQIYQQIEAICLAHRQNRIRIDFIRGNEIEQDDVRGQEWDLEAKLFFDESLGQVIDLHLVSCKGMMRYCKPVVEQLAKLEVEQQRLEDVPNLISELPANLTQITHALILSLALGGGTLCFLLL